MKRTEKFRGLSWGIAFGVCVIVCFYTAVGVIASHLILNSIAAQTSDTVPFLSEWWQALLFSVCVIAAVIAIGSLAMYVLREITDKKRREK